MLNINRLTDYALLILGEMGKKPTLIQSATALTNLLSLSLPTVSKILKLLADASLVESVRGQRGGYRLKNKPSEISLLTIITALEGPVSLTSCCDVTNNCYLSESCNMRHNWQKINKNLINLFSQVTLHDMLHSVSFDFHLKR